MMIRMVYGFLRMNAAIVILVINIIMMIYLLKIPTCKERIPLNSKELNIENELYFQNINLSYYNNEIEVPVIYVITPTYKRSSQVPDLVMLSQTLMHLNKIHWLVVEDASNTTDYIEELLQRTGLKFTYMAIKASAKDKKSKVRGCSQRNKALNWINEHVTDGIIYFADDDNSYDLRLFIELRKIKQVGILPTGHLDKTGISSPIIINGKVTNFLDIWKAGRKFPVEMASIGINVRFWLDRGSPLFKPIRPGYLETKLLEDLKITMADLEPLADNCTKIYVWHTQTVKLNNIDRTLSNSVKYQTSNIPELVKHVVFNK